MHVLYKQILIIYTTKRVAYASELSSRHPGSEIIDLENAQCEYWMNI